MMSDLKGSAFITAVAMACQKLELNLYRESQLEATGGNPLLAAYIEDSHGDILATMWFLDLIILLINSFYIQTTWKMLQGINDRFTNMEHKAKMMVTLGNELRNPARMIMGCLDTLEGCLSGALNAFQANMFKSITSCGNLLNTLVGNVSSFYSLDEKSEVPVEGPCDVREQLLNLARMCEHECDVKNINLRYKISPHIPKYIISDSDRLNQILLNMISNCIKITDYGEVTINIKYEPDLESIPKDWQQYPKQEFELQNTVNNFFYKGENKSYENLPYAPIEIQRTGNATHSNTQTVESFLFSLVTNSNEQLENPQPCTFHHETRGRIVLEFQTTGHCALGDEGKFEIEDLKQFDQLKGDKKFTSIGLQYVKYIVNHLNGRMHMKSNNVGTKFKIELNCGVSNLEMITSSLPTLNKQIEAEIHKLEGSHVLIADDKEASQRKLCDLIDSLGLTCEFVDNGLDLVEVYTENPSKFAAIISDVSLPIMNTYEAAEKIRRFEEMSAKRHVPILFKSWDMSEVDRPRAQKAGVVDFMIKPIERHVLAGQLLNKLRKRKNTEQICVYSPDQDYLERTKQILLLEDHTVVGALSEEEVLNIARKNYPSIKMFVLDVDPTKPAHIAFLDKIRKIDEELHIRRPAMVMSPTSSPEILQICETRQIDELLVKPIAQEKLTEAIIRIKSN